MAKVSVKELTEFGVRLLVKKGVPREKALYLADIAATTEACGISTHGAVMFGYYDAMVGARIDPVADPAVVVDKGAVAVIDVGRSFTQLAMRLAVGLAREKAHRHGVAMVAARNGSWLGALGVYVLPLAREGFFAQLWVQSCACKDSAPYGGIDARFSTNPVALAFPAPDGPVIADFSTAAMSMGRVRRLTLRGQRAPEPVFFDKAGRLTDDPGAMTGGGAMLLAGGLREGYKGYALALWCEALTAMAGGNCNNPTLEQRQCFNLMVIDPGAFGALEHYRAEMERFVRHVRSSRVQDGVDAIRLPGERMLRRLAESERDGVPLEPEVLDALNEVARRNGLPALRLLG